MNSRERVLTAFAHEEPDRVPRWGGIVARVLEKAKRELQCVDDEALRIRFGDDFRRVSGRLCGSRVPAFTWCRITHDLRRRATGCGLRSAHQPSAGQRVDPQRCTSTLGPIRVDGRVADP